MQQKLNERTDRLNAMKNRHNELTRTLDETETHLKQASERKFVIEKIGQIWKYWTYQTELYVDTELFSRNEATSSLDKLTTCHRSSAIQCIRYSITFFFLNFCLLKLIMLASWSHLDIVIIINVHANLISSYLQLLESSDVVLNYIKRESNSKII